MVLSDKKFIEFSEQVWERNKELLAEKRELLDEVKRLRYCLENYKRDAEDYKKMAFDRAVEIDILKKDLEEVNARCNSVMAEQYEYIRKLEDENEDLALANDCLSDIFDDGECCLEDDDRFINCTFNFNFN